MTIEDYSKPNKQSNGSETKEKKSARNKKCKRRERKSKESMGRECETYHSTAGGCGKTKEAKTSSFPQIRDFLKKKHKPGKSEFATWTANNIIEKWNSYES